MAITMKAQVYLAMDMAKKDPELSKGELRQIAKRQYDEGVARAEERYLGTKFKPGEKEHWADELQDMIDRMKSILNAHDFEDDQVERLVGRVLESEGLDLDPSSHAYRQIAEVAIRAAIQVLGYEQDRSLYILKPKPTDSLLRDTQDTPSVGRVDQSSEADILLSELIDRFFAENEVVWKPRTVEKYRGELGVIQKLLGEGVRAGSIDKATVREIKAILQVLPAN